MAVTEPLPGTSDLWEPELFDWNELENTARDVFHRYGYCEVRTPIFERTDVFVHNLGESSDVVQKEMYTFEDRGGRSLTLRPEGTAAVIRAIANKGIEQGEEVRTFYMGPMFRGERPAAGRRRQFHQIGVEAVGSNSPWMDAECIAMLWFFLEKVGASGGKLLLNSRGLPQDRPIISQALTEYFTPHIGCMCEDCQRRLTTNVSRILDCKNPACQEIINGAPHISEMFCEESKLYFSRVCQALDKLGVPYEIAPRLVRGLDYYIHTVFEITHPGLGGQDAIAGGGRYRITPPGMKAAVEGIGFAAGMERILMARASRGVAAQGSTDMDVVVLCLGEATVPQGLALGEKLRREMAGLRIKVDFSTRSLKAQMRTANKYNSRIALIIGEDELAKGQVLCRNMREASQESLALDKVSETITSMLK